ncbi:hypothetical protein ACIBUR_39440, partial [Streptomyces anulatus]
MKQTKLTKHQNPKAPTGAQNSNGIQTTQKPEFPDRGIQLTKKAPEKGPTNTTQESPNGGFQAFGIPKGIPFRHLCLRP